MAEVIKTTWIGDHDLLSLLPSDLEAVGNDFLLVDAGGGDNSDDLFDPEFWKYMGWGLAGADGDALLALQLEGVNSPAERRHSAFPSRACQQRCGSSGPQTV